jgi:hypothetical protein
MPVELVMAPEAELDIAEAYIWYEGRPCSTGSRRRRSRSTPYFIPLATRTNGASAFPDANSQRAPLRCRRLYSRRAIDMGTRNQCAFFVQLACEGASPSRLRRDTSAERAAAVPFGGLPVRQSMMYTHR